MSPDQIDHWMVNDQYVMALLALAIFFLAMLSIFDLLIESDKNDDDDLAY